MTSPMALLRSFLVANGDMTNAFGDRIYAASNLPAYDPADGPACLFSPRGGNLDYSSAVWRPSVQFRIYAATEPGAWAGFDALMQLNDTAGPNVKFFRLEENTFPYPLLEPVKNWPFILAFFRAHIGNG